MESLLWERKKKMDALKESEHNPLSAGQTRYKEQRDILLHLLRKNLKLKYREVSELLLEYEIEMSHVQIRNICVKFGDKGEIEPKKFVKAIKEKKEEGKQGESPAV
jgi:hypothetical protein